MSYLSISLIMFCLGLIVGKVISIYDLSIKNKKIISYKNDQFSQILNNIKLNKCKFKDRINNAVYLDTNIKDYGDVKVIYFMDKMDLAIFKGDKCIFTSELVNEDTLKDIINDINKKYHKKINDIVEVLGLKFNRETFERTFNVSISKLGKVGNKEDVSFVDEINNKNNKKFNIDDILDKISEVGLDKLSKDEILFLENYNNNNK